MSMKYSKKYFMKPATLLLVVIAAVFLLLAPSFSLGKPTTRRALQESRTPKVKKRGATSGNGGGQQYITAPGILDQASLLGPTTMLPDQISQPQPEQVPFDSVLPVSHEPKATTSTEEIMSQFEDMHQVISEPLPSNQNVEEEHVKTMAEMDTTEYELPEEQQVQYEDEDDDEDEEPTTTDDDDDEEGEVDEEVYEDEGEDEEDEVQEEEYVEEQKQPTEVIHETLEFHIVCHSHMETGWQMTPQEYYNIKASKIIPGVVAALQKSAERRFSFAEVYFFEKWWQLQTNQVKEQVVNLVKQGRLEFVNGGWVVSDETCPSYEEIIMNMIAGHSFLKNTFGILPKHAWQVDTYGHSAATPDLFAQMGFETVSFARTSSEQDKEDRKKNQTLEFIWQSGFDDSNDGNGIMAHVMHEMYNGPCGLDMSSPYNLKREAEAHFNDSYDFIESNQIQTLNCLNYYSSHYRTKHIMITAGADFSFMHADVQYAFLDRVISLLNGRVQKIDGVNKKFVLKYSTVDEYFTAMKKEAQNMEWPVYKGDFLPYNAAPLNLQLDDSEAVGGHYTSGMYSSRINFKKQIRDFSSMVQSSLTFYAIDLLKAKNTTTQQGLQGFQIVDRKSNKSITQELKEVDALMTAHNTITGTSTKVVIQNAEKMMKQTTEKNSEILSEAIRQMAQNEEGLIINELHQCLQKAGPYSAGSSTNKGSPSKWCPTGMTTDQYLMKNEFMAIIYNPSVFEQEYTMIPMQQQQGENGLPVSNLTVLYWDKQGKAFVDALSENFCYKKPQRVTNDETAGDIVLQDCELYVHRPIAPLSYEVVKIQFSNIGGSEGDGSNENSGKKNNVDQKDQLLNFQGETWNEDVDLDYKKLCKNPSLRIKNKYLTLRVKSCTINSITFGLRRDDISDVELDFDFDFRYYVPYHGDDLRGGGIYVFKTADKDSTPYSHVLKQIMVYEGKRTQWFLISYKNRVGPPSQVKIKLNEKAEYLEFDVFFGYLDKKRYQFGQEVTINWSSKDVDSKGVFYTDANAFRMVKRNISEPKNYNVDAKAKAMPVPSYFYPVNSGIFIEDVARSLQLVVMNDRPQGASAYHTAPTKPNGGRIEFLFMRRGVTNDQLGVNEPMEDYGTGGQPVNYTGKYYVTFTKDRVELFNIIHKRHLATMNQLQIFNTLNFKIVNKMPEDRNGFDLRKNDFLMFLNMSNVQDIQLLPSSDLNDMYLRVYRYTGPIEGKPQDPLSQEQMKTRSFMMLNQLCLYQFKDDCQDIIQDLQPTRLDGNELDPVNFGPDHDFLQMNSAQLAAGDIFTIENYKIVFKKH